MVSLRLTGASVLGPDGLGDEDLAFEAGRISNNADGREIDARGFVLAPGIVDLHGDAFIHHVAPRRGMITDPAEGLRSLDAELLAHGITTTTLAQFISWEGGMRGPLFCRRLVEAMTRAEMDCTALLQIRLERYYAEGYALARELIADGHARYLVFNDHLPHAVIAAGKRPPRLAGQSLKAGRNPEKQLQLIQELCAIAEAGPLPEEAALIDFAASHGVVLGSHDDADAETRQGWAAKGVSVAEFPTSLDAVDAAKAAGNPVIMGAPNVVRGGSHEGMIGARERIAAGQVDALVSDYFYPAMLGAVDVLRREGICDLAQAWALVSSGPAQLLALNDRGKLQTGRRADVVVLDETARRVEAVFIQGRLVMCRERFAARLMCA